MNYAEVCMYYVWVKYAAVCNDIKLAIRGIQAVN